MAELPGVDGYVASARMCRESPVAAHPSGRECVVYEQAQEHADPQHRGVFDLIALLGESQGRRAREQAQAAARLRRRALLLAGALSLAAILAAIVFLAFRQANQNAQPAQIASARAE